MGGINKITRFQSVLGYRFKDSTHIKRALTHRSAGRNHNERLEYLGDALLDFIVGDLLYDTYPKATEGELTRMRSGIVNKSALAALASKLTLDEFVILGPAETGHGKKPRDSILADTLEAIVAAVYLDGDLKNCRALVIRLVHDAVQNAHQQLHKDSKTRLQELLQAQGKALPEYTVTKICGEAHAQEFHVLCTVPLLDKGQPGCGESKRAAEQQAAEKILVVLGESREEIANRRVSEKVSKDG